ncbi:tetratricopeptide repeat protein [Pontibacter sp. MBLB2868]|uniref:tetratricopeptide repeat protein n=1 Tax=Pontibacter sp. MBLB2868 TaxID=3451555 RepID=UPI003F755263
MNKIKFWRSWDTDIKYPYLFLLLLCVVALLLGVFHYFTGEGYAFDWDKLTDLQVVPVPVHEVTRLLENFTLSAEGYLIFEQYDVALPTVNTTAATLLIGILGLCVAFYTAAISTMKQLSYFGGMLLLMLFLATFNFDLLSIFGNGASQTTLLVSIALLAISSYAFQAFWPQTRFALRIVVMMGVVATLALLIYSEAEFPARLITLHLVNYSSIGVLIATVLFMLWVSYENVNALLWINTQAKTPEKRFGLWQFVLVSTLYLVNLLLLYLRHIGYLKADLFYINGYFIFILSVIAGFWGMRQREAYYKRLFLFKPAGAVLYLVFATMAFLSIGYAFATANDPLTVLFHDLIVYTHLAFGFGFLLYILINYATLLQQRLPVYKVVYEPKRFSLFSFFLMSLMICTILVMRTQYRSYFYAQGGYYNYLGDLYSASGNPILAQRFYEESDLFDVNNVKANYNLASIYRQKNQRNSEILHLKEALEKRPSPKLYIRLANLYDEKQYFFEKMYVLQEGIAKFPESAEIYNNLALMYAATSVQDSTDYYFNLAQKYTSDEDFIESNRLAFYTRQAMLDPAKQLLGESRKGKYKTLRSNAAALRQLLGLDPGDKEAFMPDSLGAIEDLTLFYNQTISRLNEGDTSRLAPINRYLSNPGNQLFFEDLLYLKGLVHHYNGRVKEGRTILENLALQAESRGGYYYNVLGQWMLEENNYKAAAAYFKLAKDRGNKQAYLSEGYAMALANQPQQAVEALQEVGFTENEAAIAVAQDLIAVLQQDVQTVITQAPDKEKVQYLLTNLPQLNEENVDALVQAVQDKELKRRALLARVDYMMANKRWKAAYDAIQNASSKLQAEGELRSALNLNQLKVWLYTENYDALLNKMDQLYLTDRDKRQRLYFKARIAEARGRNEEAAARYEQALAMLLYDEEVVLSAARFFDVYKPKEEKAYNILLSGITYNPYSAELYKAYALESVDQGLYSYAEQAQQTLQSLLPATEYSIFIKKLDKKRQEVETRADNWQL